MNAGRIAVLGLVIPMIATGVGIWYTQVYAYYEELPTRPTYAVAGVDGPVTLSISGFRGIDSDSSPVRYRACFTVSGDAPGLADYADPTPLIAPGWFDCFDAEGIGADLEAGAARAVLVAANAPYGIDRVMALYPDGRAFVWPQINACGTAYFDEDPLPADCPPAPER